MLFAFSGYFQKSGKSVNVSPNQLVSSVPNGKSISANQNVAPTNSNSVQIAAQTDKSVTPSKSPAALQASNVKLKPSENSAAEPAEKIYFCGAETKKGTPCSRRIRGGGRCWQHEGQTAMMAQEKLLAGR